MALTKEATTQRLGELQKIIAKLQAHVVEAKRICHGATTDGWAKQAAVNIQELQHESVNLSYRSLIMFRELL